MSDTMHALALIHRSGDSYIATGTVDSVTCPACGCAIAVQDIIAGRHGPPPLGAVGWILTILVWIALIGGAILLFRSCSG